MNEIDNSQGDASRDKMLSGSAWMTAGSIFSRILGAIYIIPWRQWFGEYFYRGNALYGFGYNIYSFVLIVAIAGIPSAIAKQVSHYNAMNEYGVGIRIYKRGLILSAALGIISALVLYFGAPLLDGGNENVVPVLHSLAWAVLIIPTMSLTRGYFQGYQEMAPSAISQFVEQLARVLYMLATAYIIMEVMHGNWITAVSQSTFAAFIGALFGTLTLGFYYLKRRKHFRSLVANSDNQIRVSPKQLYQEIIAQSVPFIILGAGITIFQLIDQYTFFPIMTSLKIFTATQVSDLFAMFAANSNKLIMISISLASALAVTAVPLLSEALTNNRKEEIKAQNTNVLSMFMFTMIPAALGMAAIAGPLNRAFYGIEYHGLAANVLTVSSIVSILMGLFVVASAVMQGLSENKRAVKYFFIGTAVKLIVQWPCVHFLGVFGPLVSTAIGLLVANFLIIGFLKNRFGYDMPQIRRTLVNVGIAALVMYVVALVMVYIGNMVMSLFTDPFGGLASVIVAVIAAVIGGFVYVYLTLRTRTADLVLGARSNSLRAKLRIK
ncbi:polysaccharide biosynthesis protein [Lentilactobacillus sp. SPB1-3]|uniref:Polysaccharide biosynthesis C-terminal domain-containing protein n=1 Tax=Lentilactobacillus terminaliae TaxID=3003483 RepID=A0ACD5DHL1_9LACO|nr:polysaccharide biosynthesis protein [Lentilactobacillus sp. SPB1-3]MCZ0977015.1 polysaccharide biosynthesis protein [Lentilactobacillus sp. SPB1-3]